MEAPSRAVGEVSQALRRLRDVGVSARDGSVHVIVVNVEENDVEMLVGADALLLHVTNAQVDRLVWHATREQVDPLHV